MEKSKKNGARIWKATDKSLEALSIFIMGLMCIMVILSVGLRYIFNITYVWSEELIILLFISTTYFGSILCVKEKEHIDIPFFREKASANLGFVMDVFICLVNITIQIALLYISINWINKTGSSTTAGLKIPYYYIYSLFPLSFGSMAIYTIRRLVHLIIEKIKGKNGGVE